MHRPELARHLRAADPSLSYMAAIVLLTLAIMLLLTPLTVKSTRSMLAMQRLQPEIKRLQQQHKNDRQALNEAMMAFYKEHNVNPVGGCLPMLLQMPVFFALFHVLNSIKPHYVNGEYIYHGTTGVSRALVESAANAKIFGAPISAALKSPLRWNRWRIAAMPPR